MIVGLICIILATFLVINQQFHLLNKAKALVHVQQKTNKPIQKKTLNIVAIGDSLTQGVGDEKNHGYVGATVEKLNQLKTVRHVNVANFAHKGDKTQDLQLVLKKDHVQDKLKQANCIFMTIGGNDITGVLRTRLLNLKEQDFKNEQVAYVERLNTILKTIRKLNPKAPIFLFGLYNPFEDYFADVNNHFVQILGDWNHETESTLAKYSNTVFIPTYKTFKGKGDKLLFEDHFHPNHEGYGLLSDLLFLKIKEDLSL
ncbi:SGNH/GDSL hydrolase family protein [Terrilactibacillus tamarindi]|uniref:SGNH/GDSL hydrolase family protein n=1 Tax=Terrilactibacillus tamarindi TaxID=2599694 RepID=UPI0012BD411F|nr:SGNH/GDSL hydrolase family protein [Terrilactibacillus tamarindi]